MKKRNVKLLVVATALIICLALSAIAFTACNKDMRVSYAEAQKNWQAAEYKMVTDELVVSADVGGENSSPITLTLSGYRAYLGEEWVMHYTLIPQGLDAFLNGFVASLIENSGVDIVVKRTADGMLNITLSAIGMQLLSTSVAESVIGDYLPVFDFADSTFYDAESLSGSEDGSFSISGDDSIAYILYQIAPILSKNFGFDLLPMLDEWLTLGDVTGKVTFADGNFATMTTSQDIEVYIPDEDALFLAYNVDNFPDLVLQFFEEKKIDFKIDTGGSLGVLTISINFADEFADGIRLSANVASHAEYTLLSSDATFDGIEADYAATHGSANA